MRRYAPFMAIAAGAALGIATSAMTFASGEIEQTTVLTPRSALGTDSPTLINTLAAAVGFSSGEPAASGLVLRAPENPEVLLDVPPFASPKVASGHLRAQAYHFDSHVFRRPSKRPRAIGLVRRGVVLEASRKVRGAGCKGGAWYALAGTRGVVCSRDGFAISTGRQAYDVRQPPPAVTQALPFKYAKAVDGAYRFYRVPTAAEIAALEAHEPGDRPPEVVERTMDGVFLLALDRLHDSAEYYRTVRGRYVRANDVALKDEPAMRGELLGKNASLPLAFVFGEEDAPVYERLKNGRARSAGIAQMHARFPLRAVEDWNGQSLGVSRAGFSVPRERLRIARPVDRPAEIASHDKWIHIDLDEQTLVAYEGDTPVFATLVSSGKDDGFATPDGLYQIREKHISVTMNGPDPDNGFYEVEEVPWTMYYKDSFALHGAYWHNNFGNTRSHGCTNLSPIDARYLFYWTEDAVPKGWQALRQLKGTWVYLTRADSA